MKWISTKEDWLLGRSLLRQRPNEIEISGWDSTSELIASLESDEGDRAMDVYISPSKTKYTLFATVLCRCSENDNYDYDDRDGRCWKAASRTGLQDAMLSVAFRLSPTFDLFKKVCERELR